MTTSTGDNPKPCLDKEDYSIFKIALNKHVSLSFINKIEDYDMGLTSIMKGKIEKIQGHYILFRNIPTSTAFIIDINNISSVKFPEPGIVRV